MQSILWQILATDMLTSYEVDSGIASQNVLRGFGRCFQQLFDYDVYDVLLRMGKRVLRSSQEADLACTRSMPLRASHPKLTAQEQDLPHTSTSLHSTLSYKKQWDVDAYVHLSLSLCLTSVRVTERSTCLCHVFCLVCVCVPLYIYIYICMCLGVSILTTFS